jgi:hypothetical protein
VTVKTDSVQTELDKHPDPITIRRGVIEMERNVSTDTSDPRSYIKTDRLVATDTDEYDITDALPRFNDSIGTAYDEYQVNPAYTSVMHDIKLTTRGGARLSDILPDFINKGIYVVDTTYQESASQWENWNSEASTGSITKAECAAHTTKCPVSPWTGFVPKPQCPPGYAKVITVHPAGWAMAQAGIPTNTSGVLQDDLLYNYMPKDPFYEDEETPEGGWSMTPLFFQKSTWLRSKAYPHCSGGNCKAANATFYGWSVIMGFIYPYEYFEEFIIASGARNDFPSDNVSNEYLVLWNLFPVYRKELEAYATVYCYFDRGDSAYSKEYVDKYNQLKNYRVDYDKDSDYTDRLNDPTLKYSDPW